MNSIKSVRFVPKWRNSKNWCENNWGKQDNQNRRGQSKTIFSLKMKNPKMLIFSNNNALMCLIHRNKFFKIREWLRSKKKNNSQEKMKEKRCLSRGMQALISKRHWSSSIIWTFRKKKLMCLNSRGWLIWRKNKKNYDLLIEHANQSLFQTLLKITRAQDTEGSAWPIEIPPSFELSTAFALLLPYIRIFAGSE